MEYFGTSAIPTPPPVTAAGPSLSSGSDSPSSNNSAQNCVRRSGRTTQWSKEEDEALLRLVEKYGQQKWSVVASYLPDRKGKQCRERWHNHLRRDIKKGEWSAEEEKLLVEAHRALGNRWAEIARCMVGRSENAVKNHFNATMRRKERAAGGRKKCEGSRPSVLRVYLKDQGLASSSQADSDEKTSGLSESGGDAQESSESMQMDSLEVTSPPAATSKQAVSVVDPSDRGEASERMATFAEISSPPLLSLASHEKQDEEPATSPEVSGSDAETELTLGPGSVSSSAKFRLSSSGSGTGDYVGSSRLRLAALNIQPCASAFTVVPSCATSRVCQYEGTPFRATPLNSTLLVASFYPLPNVPSLVW